MKNRKLVIAFDANPITQSNITGIGEYEKRLVEALSKYSNSNVQLIGYYYNFFGRKKSIDLPRLRNVTYKAIKLYPGGLVNALRRLGLEVPVEFLIKSRCDVALFPNYLTQPSLFGAQIVVFVHDLTYVLYPDFMADKNQKDLARYVPKSLSRSKSLITISKSTESQIIEEYAYDKEILVTPIPYTIKNSSTRITIDEVQKKYPIKNNYVLSVGTIEPRKNIIGLIDGFSSNDELKNKFSLVLCGKKGWKSDKIFERIALAKKEGISIIITGYVSDDVKKCLYENCAAVVLPSFYEGFGMPILEALAYKKPLALSDIKVFHEVAGDAGYYFALNSSKSMSDIILKATRSRTNKNNSPYSKITWEDIANKLLQHFEKISKT